VKRGWSGATAPKLDPTRAPSQVEKHAELGDPRTRGRSELFALPAGRADLEDNPKERAAMAEQKPQGAGPIKRSTGIGTPAALLRRRPDIRGRAATAAGNGR